MLSIIEASHPKNIFGEGFSLANYNVSQTDHSKQL
jgi:hypothetical protein